MARHMVATEEPVRRAKQTKAKRLPKKEYKAQAKAREQELFDKLAKGVEELDLSKWREMLTTQSAFIEYSFMNTMLIVLTWEEMRATGVVENIPLTVVAPRTRWAKRKRTIRQDCRAKGMPIFVPMVVTRKRRDDDPKDEEEKRRVFFRIRWVYDVTQTEGEPFEQPHPVQVTGNEAQVTEYRETLTEYLNEQGIQVEFKPLTMEDPIDLAVQGFWVPSQRRIVVGTRRRDGVVLTEPMQLRILLHEAAHALLGHELGGPEQEIEAESTAYTVGTSIGLDLGDYSFGYVKGWLSTLPEDKRSEQMLAVGARIIKTTQRILKALGYDPRRAECDDTDSKH